MVGHYPSTVESRVRFPLAVKIECLVIYASGVTVACGPPKPCGLSSNLRGDANKDAHSNFTMDNKKLLEMIFLEGSNPSTPRSLNMRLDICLTIPTAEENG